MLRSIVICPDQELGRRLTGALDAAGMISVSRVLNQYPNSVDLIRTLRAHAPEVVFMSFESVERARDTVRSLETEAEGIQIIAVHHHCDAAVLRETMRVGVREFLSDPFDPASVREALDNVRSLLDRRPVTVETTDQIFAFLPSKAGVGTSMIALNVAAALAARPATRVLLSDLDLNSGIMRFMLKLKNEYSVTDAVEHSAQMDENLWPQLVTTFGALDVLHAGRVNPNLRIESSQIRSLVEFSRRNYRALCFDLSGNLERYSLELMQESKRILMVCTPELASLYLAREKLAFLRGFDLESRVSILLNRCQKRALFSKEQVEEILGLKVTFMFPNDYQAVNRAMTAGSWIDPNSSMGKPFAEFAQMLIESRLGSVEKRRFLEHFSVQPRSLTVSEK